MRPRRAAAALALGLCFAARAPAHEVVVYAHRGATLEVEYRWSPQGLAAHLSSGPTLWTFDPVHSDFHRGLARAGDIAPDCGAGLPENVSAPRILQLDRNRDARIDAAAGDTARLYFGAAPAGQGLFFALDVSDPFAPAVRWVSTARELRGLGSVIGPASFARLDLGADRAGGPQQWAVLFGAGAGAATTRVPRLFALDAHDGTLLWSAGDGGASLNLAGLSAAFNGGIAALDLDADGYADRLYAGDDAGVLWRFDLAAGRSGKALATGGALARLDGALRGTPDVALLARPGARPRLAITLATAGVGPAAASPGGGWLYSLRDLQPFTPLTQAQFDALRPVVATDLALVPRTGTAPAVSEAGWRLPLAPGEWLPDATLTADQRLLFTSFRVDANATRASCELRGQNDVYVMWLDDAAAALDLDGNGHIDARDRSRTLAQRQVAGGVRVMLPRGPDAAAAPVCSAGDETLPACLGPATPLRSYWYRSDAQ